MAGTNPQQQQQSATPGATPNPQADAAAPETAELDVTALLVADDDGTPAAEPKDEAPGATDGAAAAAADGDEGEGEGGEGAASGTDTPADADGGGGAAAAADNKPQPGTPDKALQKLQQNFAASTRKLDEIAAKLESGQALTGKEQQQLQTERRNLDAVREAMKAKGADFDLLEHDTAIAETLIEHDEGLTGVRKELAETRELVNELRQDRAAAQAQADWAANEQAYPGVQVKTVWSKAIQDAVRMCGVQDPSKLPADSPLHGAIEHAANELFHARAAAAAKGVQGRPPAAGAGKPGKAPQQQQQQTPRSAPPVTPGGTRVTQGSGVVSTGEPSEDSRYIQDALSLVVDD